MRAEPHARPQGSPAGGPHRDDLFPWIVGIFGAVVLFVWSGAAVASAVTGHGGRIRFSDAGTALIQLPSHLSDPKQAWPLAVRPSLPGAFAYWAAQFCVFV